MKTAVFFGCDAVLSAKNLTILCGGISSLNRMNRRETILMMEAVCFTEKQKKYLPDSKVSHSTSHN